MAKHVSGARPTLLRPSGSSRAKRIEAMLGRDWKVALPFILPMVVLMAGLIFWPFINAILISFTVRTLNRTE